MLEDKSIDAVLISTPDHWHTLPAIHACQAGKDVYCEKPLTLFIAEGQALVKAVRRYQRVFQTGSMQRSSEEFRIACELVRNGAIGKIEPQELVVGHESDLLSVRRPEGEVCVVRSFERLRIERVE